jgi:hypothetical protein
MDGADPSVRGHAPDADIAASSFPPIEWRAAAIEVRSTLRRMRLSTPLSDETAWIMLLVPDGSTDAQVLEWAERTLPPEAVADEQHTSHARRNPSHGGQELEP